MINFDRVPIIKGLEFYKNQNNAAFHMPGHKQNRANMSELEFLKHNLYRYDVTEVPGTDNLFHPEEMIRESQKLLAQAMSASKSYMLVNGSTCGIYAMIMGLLNKKDKIIVQRNCHKSVHTAIYLGELESVYVYPKVVEGFNIPSSVSVTQILKAIEANSDAKAVMITSPTYYGTCADIRSIAKVCKEKDLLLLVDEAHGAHFNFSDLLPECAINLGADIAVTSFHKTLPAFTQTAVLNLSSSLSKKQIENIESKLEMFESSSPSYILLASIDMARYLMQEKGEKMIDGLFTNINYVKTALKNNKNIKILDETYLINERHDFTRLVITTPLNGNDLSIILRDKYKIQVEMADFNNIVLIGSVSDTIEMYERLINALKDIFKGAKPDVKQNKVLESMEMPKPKIVFSWHEAEQHQRELIDISKSEGRISAECLIPYPPGVPLILPGEEIDKEILSFIEKLDNDNLRLTKSLSGYEIERIYVIQR